MEGLYLRCATSTPCVFTSISDTGPSAHRAGTPWCDRSSRPASRCLRAPANGRRQSAYRLGSGQTGVGVPNNGLRQLAAHGEAPPAEPVVGPHRIRGDPVVPQEGAVDEARIACAGLEKRLKDIGLRLLAVIQSVSVGDPRKPVSWVPSGARPKSSGPPELRPHPWTRIR